ncbi:MAG: 1-deoxy-D-xylulose-5-phosphate reductoisomerase [Clostridia bacterium]|nr:1-deoxy-D-xylulose-5-phosphate reductoisomerase [Clostridia bacterium]
MKRTIAIAGATGSIGTQALDIVRRHPDRFSAVALTAYSSAEKLFALVREFQPQVAGLVVEPEQIPEDLRHIEWIFGADVAERSIAMTKPDDALMAVVGIGGLPAVLSAIEHAERILLANKEALVTGGELVLRRIAEKKKALLPVDSEHSAIFQCLQAANGNPARSLWLTASGGALRSWTKAQIQNASVADVLRHPTWQMGAKITVDCAGMMNKGLEVIEAYHLFGVPLDDIRVVVHPESIIHSMVEFRDGAVLAQLGHADMRGPIGYAMGFPERIDYAARPLNFAELGRLTFEAPDLERFPCLGYAIEAQRAGGSMPVVLNGANEVAVDAFLKGHIPFGRIAEAVLDALNGVERTAIECVEDVFEADRRARAHAEAFLRRNL